MYILQLIRHKYLTYFTVSEKEKLIEEVPRGLMGRVFGAVADRGRELTARLVLPPTQA